MLTQIFNKKRIIIFSTVILALVAGVLIWQFKGQIFKKSGEQGNILANKERNLNSEQKQVYYDRIKKAEEDLKTDTTNPNYHNRQINDYIYLGQQYFGLGEMQKSREAYDYVLKLDANNEAALVGLVYVFSEAGDYNLADGVLNKALNNNKKNYNLWLQYVDLRKAMGDGPEKIAQIYQDALKETNNYPDIQTKYAQFLESMGNINEAILVWQEAVKNNPESAELYEQEINRLKGLKK